LTRPSRKDKVNSLLWICSFKKGAEIAQALHRWDFPEPRKDIGFSPAGAERRYGIIVQNNPINFIDPSGEFFILGSIVGAGVGAAAGGFGAVLGGSTDARSILSAAAVGAVSGFVGGGFGVTYAIGGIIGAFGGAAGAALMGGNPGAIAGAALGGAVGGIIGGLPGVGLPGLAYGTWIGSSWGTAYGLVGQEIYKLFLRESPAKQVCN